MATAKVIVNGTTIVDMTDATATADKILAPYTAYGADGSKLTGTASMPTPTLIAKSITSNGTYDPEDDNADGYSSVIVNVSGSGDAWTWMGRNPTLVHDYGVEKVWLKDTGYATWTPTTSSTTIVSSSRYASQTGLDYTSYDYVGVQWFHSHLEYGSGATETAQISDVYCFYSHVGFAYYGSLGAMTSGDVDIVMNGQSSQSNGTFYKTTSGVDSFMTSASYGIFPTISSPIVTYDASIQTGGKFGMYKPDVKARCNSSYFSTGNAAVVNQDESYYEISAKLYRVDRATSDRSATWVEFRNAWLNDMG